MKSERLLVFEVVKTIKNLTELILGNLYFLINVIILIILFLYYYFF